jgi:uncharacterized protein
VKKLYLFITFIVISFCCKAQNFNDTLAKALLWQVSGNGINTPSYLFGTMEGICKEDFITDSIVLKTLELCKVLYFKINSNQKSKDSIDNAGLLKGTTLKKIIGKVNYRRVVKATNKYQSVIITNLNHLRPAVVAGIIQSQFLQCQTISINEVLKNFATKNKIPVYQLESVSEQLEKFEPIIKKDETQNLLKLLDHPDSVLYYYRKTISFYKDRDIPAIYSAWQNKKLRKIILDDRNRLWMPTIEKSISDNASFFAIDILHLAGENGIINLLLQKGYILKPVW